MQALSYTTVYRLVVEPSVRLLSRSHIFPWAKPGFRLRKLVGLRRSKLVAQQGRGTGEPRRIVVHDYAGHPFQVQLSREFARRGHDVLHLYCASYPNGRGPLGLRPNDPPTFRSEPIVLWREVRKYSLWRRPLQEVEYGLRLRRRLSAFRPDIVISGNTPLIAQTLTQVVARSLGAGFVFWQQDIHGLAMDQIARTKIPVAGQLIGPLFPALERRLLRRSDAVVAVTDHFLDTLRAWKVPLERTTVIENWAPIEELPVQDRNNRWRQEHGIAGESLFLYSGTLGLKHDCDLLFQLARTLDARGAKLVVASEGLGADVLTERLTREPLDGLLLLPFQPFERLAEMLGAADVFVSLLDRQLGAYSVPSKVLTYHCAGRPILAAMPLENPASQLILRAGSGIVVEPEEGEEFLTAAVRLLEDAELRAELGVRARSYAQAAFDVKLVADRFEDVLRRLAQFADERSIMLCDGEAVSANIPRGSGSGIRRGEGNEDETQGSCGPQR